MLLELISILVISATDIQVSFDPDQDTLIERHQAAQSQTVNIIRRLGKSIEKLIRKEGKIPSDAKNLNLLLALLKEKKLLPESFPSVDGWHNSLLFRLQGAKSYSIKSRGSDNKEEILSIGIIPPECFYLDIEWANGEFKQQPRKPKTDK